MNSIAFLEAGNHVIYFFCNPQLRASRFLAYNSYSNNMDARIFLEFILVRVQKRNSFNHLRSWLGITDMKIFQKCSIPNQRVLKCSSRTWYIIVLDTYEMLNKCLLKKTYKWQCSTLPYNYSIIVLKKKKIVPWNNRFHQQLCSKHSSIFCLPGIWRRLCIVYEGVFLHK